jgi:hypothetical protein
VTSALSTPISYCIIEKAALHRSIIHRYAQQLPDLKLSWECEFQETAHQAFEQHIPDLIFMSLRQLPLKVDGLLRPILSEHRGIVITSGFYPAQLGDVPFKPLAFLQKPFSFKQFVAVIERYKQLSTLT